MKQPQQQQQQRRQQPNDGTSELPRQEQQEQKQQNEWNRLEDEYQQLSIQQRQMEEWLQDLKREEMALQQAMDHVVTIITASSSTGPSLPSRKPSHQQAIDRLAEALLADYDDDDDDDDDDSDE